MDSETRYQNALDYLYSFVDHSMTRALRYGPEKFNLERMIRLAEVCGNPQKMYPVIHIAGTKGKGSTAAMVASCLKAAGYKAGLYTSPHLTEFTERIKINGLEIDKLEFAELVEWLKPFVAQVPELTTFELTTMIGFQYFAQEKVDIGVIEVGLGGRLDATNIVDPLVSVITSLSLDHTNVLGDSLEKIAYEKAGIIKSGKPVVLAPQKAEAQQVVEDICRERQSPLIKIGEDIMVTVLEKNLSEQLIQINQVSLLEQSYGKPDCISIKIPLLGSHQAQNAGTAFGALQVVAKSGFRVSAEDYKKGFSSVYWPGRFEILQEAPPIIVDSAHNPDSALKLKKTLMDYMTGKNFVLLFGASEDKDVEGMLAELAPLCNKIIVTQSVHPRALEVEKLMSIAKHYNKPVIAILDVRQAFDEALNIIDSETGILVTGSLFIVAAIREYWAQMCNSRI